MKTLPKSGGGQRDSRFNRTGWPGARVFALATCRGAFYSPAHGPRPNAAVGGRRAADPGDLSAGLGGGDPGAALFVGRRGGGLLRIRRGAGHLAVDGGDGGAGGRVRRMALAVPALAGGTGLYLPPGGGRDRHRAARSGRTIRGGLHPAAALGHGLDPGPSGGCGDGGWLGRKRRGPESGGGGGHARRCAALGRRDGRRRWQAIEKLMNTQLILAQGTTTGIGGVGLWTLVLGGIVFVVALVALIIVLNFGMIWVRAFTSGASVRISELIALRL